MRQPVLESGSERGDRHSHHDHDLGVHRQTLVYRLRKAEQLTGLKPTSTRGAAMLWLALQAADSAHLSLHDLMH
jgi:sugar diacid utilization regulator